MKNLFIKIFIIFQIINLISSEDKYFIKINDHEYLFELKDTAVANEIKSKLPFTIKMTNLNGNEVYHRFGQDFTKNEKSVGTINTGDIYLYESDCLVLFYKTFSTSFKYSEIGKLKDPTGLDNVIGSGDVIVYWCLNNCTDEISSNSLIKMNVYLLLVFLSLMFL